MNNNKIDDMQEYYNRICLLTSFAEWIGRMASRVHCWDDIFRLQDVVRMYDRLVDLMYDLDYDFDDEYDDDYEEEEAEKNDIDADTLFAICMEAAQRATRKLTDLNIGLEKKDS